MRLFLFGPDRTSVATTPSAGVAELVDALDSKSSIGNNVRVRVPLPAPETERDPDLQAEQY